MAKWKHTKTPRSILNRNARWLNAHTKGYKIRLIFGKDDEIIKFLETKENKSQTIREALYLYRSKIANEYSGL